MFSCLLLATELVASTAHQDDIVSLKRRHSTWTGTTPVFIELIKSVSLDNTSPTGAPSMVVVSVAGFSQIAGDATFDA